MRFGGAWESPAHVARDDFTACVALVEAGRVLAPQAPLARRAWMNGDLSETTPIAGTLKEFRDEVTRLPRPGAKP
jgi:hypothetical protein